MPQTEHVHKQLVKGLDYREIGDKFGVGASTACEKVNTAGSAENLARCPSTASGASASARGAQISAQAPTEGYVQTRAGAAVTVTNSEWGLVKASSWYYPGYHRFTFF